MKIGLFTDTYFPSINGITYVIDILQRNIELLGHEAYIFAPEPRARHWFRKREHRVIRFPALEGLFFEEQLTSFFFPSRQLRRVAELELDAIVIFTPAQVGLMGAYAAVQLDIPLIEQYSTDLVAYTKQYPAVLPGVLALLLSSPVALRVRPREFAQLTKSLRSQRDRSLTFSQDTVRHTLAILHARCDLIVAVSEKTAKQISSYDGNAPVTIIPTGVDPLIASQKDVVQWRRRWRVTDGDIVYLYAGRLSKEKNIELLLASFEKVAHSNQHCHLVIAGSFSHEKTLKDFAATLSSTDRIHFIGRMPRDKLGAVYAAADIFCFPSATDTQALVINEAAHAGLPIIWCDADVNRVAVDGVTGILTKANRQSFSQAMQLLATNHSLRRQLSAAAKAAARKNSEKQQTKKLIQAIKQTSKRSRS